MSESVCVWVVECFTLVGPLKVPVGITGTGYVDCLYLDDTLLSC